MTAMIDAQRHPVILIIEDELSYQDALNVGLSTEGFNIVGATSIAQAREYLVSNKPDLVLLDVMLPDGSGIDYCRELHDTTHVPVIIVTARSSEVDVVLGLEIGAADYVTKPFEPKELAARIRALLRRARATDGSAASLTFGELEILPEAGVVRLAGDEVHLTRTEFLLLCELAANAGKVLSREQLLERVWSYDYFGDGRLVDVHVRRLRTKVEPDPANPRHVLTVRGLGYKLAP